MTLEELQAAIDNAQSNNLYIPLPILEAAKKWLELQTLVAAAFTPQGDTK